MSSLMKILEEVTKWGVGSKPSHVKFTDSLKEFMLEQLGMDLHTTKRIFPQKRSLDELNVETQLPKEFCGELLKDLSSDQVSSDFHNRIKNSIGRSYLDLIQAQLGDIQYLV